MAGDPSRFKVLACGRRWGKTRLGSALCLETALKGGRSWWVAPSYKVGRVGWRLLRRLAQQIPQTQILETDKRIELPSGGCIEVRSADDPDSLRGEGLDFVDMDECAFMSERAWTEAIYPSLMDRQGRALFTSTPKGRNWFWRLYQRGQDKDAWPDWSSWSFSSRTNPFLFPGEIDQLADGLPERVRRQEIDAEFLEDGGGVFRRVLESVRGDTLESGASGVRYVIGVDWARIRDFTVFAVCDPTSRSCVRVERMGNIDYATQIMRLKELHRRFPGTILAEENSMGGPLIERLQREGLPVRAWTTTNASKSQAVDSLALAFERGEIAIPDDPVLIAELQAYESERLPGGLIRYAAPEGMHDDCVTALMIAWQGCARPMEAKVYAGGRPSIEAEKWL